MSRLKRETVDVIQIDAEGYDGEILKMIDLARYKPIIVNFEFLCLSKRELEWHAERFVDHGYSIFRDRSDMTAYKPIRSWGID